MLRFSQTYVIAEEDAENIVQDTFLYLWEHLELLEDIDHLDAFLFTLIKNRCLNFLKHQSYIQAKTCSLKADEEMESQLNLYALEQFDEAVSSISEVENLLSRTLLYPLQSFEGLLPVPSVRRQPILPSCVRILF